MNLALADIRHRLGRFLATCLGLALLMAVALSMIGIYAGLVAETLTLVRSQGADLWVVEQGTLGPFAESSRMPGDARAAVARLAGVEAAGSLTFQTVEGEAEGRRIRMQVVGFETARAGGPPMLAAGRVLGPNRGEMVLDRTARLPLGASVVIADRRFRVVGLTDRVVASGGDPVAFVSLRDSQDLQFRLAPPAQRRADAAGAAGAATNTVNAVIARLRSGTDPARVAADVRQWKHLAALTQDEQEELLTRSVVQRARQQIGLFTVVLLVVSAVIIALILYTMTMDKTRAIATLKLIGAPDRAIVGMIIVQAMALGAIAFAGAVGLVFAAKDAFPRRVALGVEEVAAMGTLVALICLLASLAGVRAALRIDAAQALSG
ncbi:MAG: ABC transporter permease [Acetobacteraceae bacterium]|nr:ABC transporter permease [Acetobacteraceae bacterium]